MLPNWSVWCQTCSTSFCMKSIHAFVLSIRHLCPLSSSSKKTSSFFLSLLECIATFGNISCSWPVQLNFEESNPASALRKSPDVDMARHWGFPRVPWALRRCRAGGCASLIWAYRGYIGWSPINHFWYVTAFRHR